MGLKYWAGASEDHYGLPHLGLHGYPQHGSIHTFDKKAWERILSKTGLKYYRFSYPFPDYKLPKVILSDEFIKRDPYSYSALYMTSSRDYVKLWEVEGSEFLLWKTLHGSGYLEDFSNSFFIVISDSQEKLDEVLPYDFDIFTTHPRKPGYRTTTFKFKDSSQVNKISLYPGV